MHDFEQQPLWKDIDRGDIIMLVSAILISWALIFASMEIVMWAVDQHLDAEFASKKEAQCAEEWLVGYCDVAGL